MTSIPLVGKGLGIDSAYLLSVNHAKSLKTGRPQN